MPDHKDEKDPLPLMTRFFHACLLLLAGVLVIWLALQVLAEYYGWLLFLAAFAGLIWGLVWFIRWRRDGRW